MPPRAGSRIDLSETVYKGWSRVVHRLFMLQGPLIKDDGSKKVEKGKGRRWLTGRGEFCQQRLGCLQIDCVKAFGEPTINFSQQLMGFRCSSFLLPEPG